MRLVTLCSVVLLGCAVGLAGCGDDDGGDAAESITQLIGPEGGTVELASGGKVEIPAGALDAELEITITKLNDADVTLPDNLEPAGKPYAFKPHDTMFALPVKIELPYTGSDLDVRPIKRPNEDPSDATMWTTVAPSEKDEPNNKVSGDVTSFSVMIAARPRRNSGVITLPDGAIDDGSMGGTGGSGGTSGSAGEEDGGAEDAGGRGGTGGTDGGTAGAGTGGSGGAGGTDGGVACYDPPVPVTALTSVDDVVSTGGGVLVATDGKITRYLGTGTGLANPVDLILPAVGGNERFASLDVNGGRVVATAGVNGSGTRIACADATVNGTGSTTYFDLQTYSMYQVALNLGPVAYVPKSGHVATDGFIAVVQEMTYGGIVVLDPTNCTPLWFQIGPDPSNGPLTGAVGLELLQGAVLVAAIEKNSAPTFRGVRTFAVNDGVTMLDEEAITAGRIDALNHAPSTLGSSYLLSIFPNPEFQLITVYVNSGTGEMLVEPVPFASGTTGRQVRDVASTGNTSVASTPLFGGTPMPGLEVFVTGEGNAVELREQVPLPAGFYGDSLSVYPSDQWVYIAGPGLLVFDAWSCN